MTYEEVIYSVQKSLKLHMKQRDFPWASGSTCGSCSSLQSLPIQAFGNNLRLGKCLNLGFSAIHHCTVIYLPVSVKYMLSPGDPDSVY